MSKLKVLLPIIFIVVVVGIGFAYLEGRFGDNSNSSSITSDLKVIQSDGITWYQDKLKTFNLAVFDKPIEVSFISSGAQSIKSQALLKDYRLAVNGTYYRGTYADAEHSGLLQIRGDKISSIVNDPQKQVTHVVIYDHDEDSLEFVRTQDLIVEEYSSDRYTLFQTGPLVIRKNEIQSKSINNSLNGKGKYTRTLLGYTEDGDKFVYTARVGTRLEEAANLLLSMDQFSGKRISVVNLDGGASTAMYSFSQDEFNFGETKRLPSIIGIK